MRFPFGFFEKSSLCKGRLLISADGNASTSCVASGGKKKGGGGSSARAEQTLSIPTSKAIPQLETAITQFYKNRSVFITGATGFVGKATVEKILRTCPEVGNVFILVRPKAGSGVSERVEDLLNNSVRDLFAKGKVARCLIIVT